MFLHNLQPCLVVHCKKEGFNFTTSRKYQNFQIISLKAATLIDLFRVVSKDHACVRISFESNHTRRNYVIKNYKKNVKKNCDARTSNALSFY